MEALRGFPGVTQVAAAVAQIQSLAQEFHMPWVQAKKNFFFFLSFVVVVVAISWAAPAAYGGSQARG